MTTKGGHQEQIFRVNGGQSSERQFHEITSGSIKSSQIVEFARAGSYSKELDESFKRKKSASKTADLGARKSRKTKSAQFWRSFRPPFSFSAFTFSQVLGLKNGDQIRDRNKIPRRNGESRKNFYPGPKSRSSTLSGNAS